MDKSEISKNLKKIRQGKNITQQKLSENMNCSEVYISNLERDMANPSVKTIINMANSLDVPLSSIINEDMESETYNQIYGRKLGELNSGRTMCILEMIYKIKGSLIKYMEKYYYSKDMIAEDIDYKSLSNNIESLREEKKITKAVMAKRLGMKEGTYRNIESNTNKASFDRYMEIANELDVSIDYLFKESLSNKEIISKEYINKIYQGTDEKEKRILEDLVDAISTVLRAHGV